MATNGPRAPRTETNPPAKAESGVEAAPAKALPNAEGASLESGQETGLEASSQEALTTTGIGSLVQPSGLKPDRVKENRCEVFKDENAKAKLAEWGYPWMGGSRYPFDENLKGWEPFDTPQDASYYGIWTSTDRMATVSYTEGDVYLVIAPTAEAFREEIRGLWDWNHNYDPKSGVHTQLDSPKLVSAYLKGHPPFDQVMTAYQQKEVLGKRFEELHAAVLKTLEDPSLPKGQFWVRKSEDHAFFLRGRPGDQGVICVCKIDSERPNGYDLNQPDHVLHSSSHWQAEGLAALVELLEGFLKQNTKC